MGKTINSPRKAESRSCNSAMMRGAEGGQSLKTSYGVSIEGVLVEGEPMGP